MSESSYIIEFDGKIIPGWEIEEVKANLAKMLKADEGKITRLFSGKRFVIKKKVDPQNAYKIDEAFKNAGADLILTEIPSSRPAAPPPLPAQEQEQPDESNQTPAVVARPALVPTDIRPKSYWYFVAILLFIAPMIFGGSLIYSAFSSNFSGGMRLRVPGETTLEVEEAGTYVFLYETSVFAQKEISAIRYGRDFEIAMMDLSTGQGLRLRPPEFRATETYGARVRMPVAEVEFDTSGNYYAEVAGEFPGNDSLLVRRTDFAGMINAMVSGFVLLFIGFITGPIMALVVFIKRHINKRKNLNAPMGEDEERKWAMFAHIGTFSTMFVPLGNFLAPIIIWQLKKNESEFVVDQAKEALNFQITVLIYALLSFLLVFIFIGFFLLFGLVIFSLIVVIVAGVKANDGEYYRYPMCIRLISQKRYPAGLSEQ
ncbi:MAG: DUF4870 domain-containing protein [Desulfobacterales bacterium]|jgi:hypothetical protein